MEVGGRARQVFLDQPFVDTGLTYYEESVPGNDCLGLADSYLDCGVDKTRLVKFAKAVGVRAGLTIEKTRCAKNPQRSYLWKVGGNRTSSAIDEDYVFPGFDRIASACSLEISKFIWNTMCSLPRYPDYLRATYQNNQSRGAHYADSQLVHQYGVRMGCANQW